MGAIRFESAYSHEVLDSFFTCWPCLRPGHRTKKYLWNYSKFHDWRQDCWWRSRSLTNSMAGFSQTRPIRRRPLLRWYHFGRKNCNVRCSLLYYRTKHERLLHYCRHYQQELQQWSTNYRYRQWSLELCYALLRKQQ